jgi:SAM-dependent methyltransferase
MSNPMQRFYDNRLYASYFPVEAGRSLPLRYHRVVAIAKDGLRSAAPRVLEIGPETSQSALFVRDSICANPSDYACLDVSDRVVSSLRSSGIEAAVLDVSYSSLPNQDGTVDLVVMSEVLEHLLDPDHALDEIQRVLKPGGLLVLTTPNLASWFNRLLLLAGVQPLYTETGTEWVLGRGRWLPRSRPVGHVHLFVLSALRELLALHRFEVLGVQGLRVDSALGRGRVSHAIDSVLSRFPSLASGFLVSATRSRG